MQEELRLSDVVCILDGGSQGNESAMSACFAKGDGSYMQKQKMSYLLVSDEESFGERRERIKGFIQQSEGMHLFCRTYTGLRKPFRQAVWVGENACEKLECVQNQNNPSKATGV